MVYLADTNILLRLVDRTHPLHPVMRGALRKLRAAGHFFRPSSQDFAEFWNVATRPAAHNGMGWSLVETDRLLRVAERVVRLLPDDPAIYPEWRQLVVAFGVSGVKVYDARLVATMQVHAVTHILTLNTADFARYGRLGIVAVDPQTI